MGAAACVGSRRRRRRAQCSQRPACRPTWRCTGGRSVRERLPAAHVPCGSGAGGDREEPKPSHDLSVFPWLRPRLAPPPADAAPPRTAAAAPAAALVRSPALAAFIASKPQPRAPARRRYLRHAARRRLPGGRGAHPRASDGLAVGRRRAERHRHVSRAGDGARAVGAVGTDGGAAPDAARDGARRPPAKARAVRHAAAARRLQQPGDRAVCEMGALRRPGARPRECHRRQVRCAVQRTARCGVGAAARPASAGGARAAERRPRRQRCSSVCAARAVARPRGAGAGAAAVRPAVQWAVDAAATPLLQRQQRVLPPHDRLRPRGHHPRRGVAPDRTLAAGSDGEPPPRGARVAGRELAGGGAQRDCARCGVGDRPTRRRRSSGEWHDGGGARGGGAACPRRWRGGRGCAVARGRRRARRHHCRRGGGGQFACAVCGSRAR